MNGVSVVMAHGGWADGSSWSRLIIRLAAHGDKAVAAPLPLTDLADDVAALNRAFERLPGPVVLTAHAYAGAVIGLARAERTKAKNSLTWSSARSRIRRLRNSHQTATTCSGSPTTPFQMHSHPMHRPTTSLCWLLRSGPCGSPV